MVNGVESYDGFHLRRHRRGFLHRQRSLRPALRETLIMETTIAGIIAGLLFIYLLVAMVRPEKF